MMPEESVSDEQFTELVGKAVRALDDAHEDATINKRIQLDLFAKSIPSNLASLPDDTWDVRITAVRRG